MKKSFLLIIASCNIFLAGAQSISTQTLNATGNSSVSGNTSLEWSIGEMTAVQTLTAPGLVLTQGILQPIVANAPLPISLLYFTGKTINGQNILSWATSQEINNHHFDVERSADGIVFQLLITVPGSGNSSTLKNYNATDPFPYTDTYYRLKQVDIDGKYSYSPVIRLRINQELSYGIYPNPATHTINVAGQTPNQSLEISIFEMSGKMVLQKTGLSNGPIGIGIQHLSKGVYIITIKELRSALVWSAKFIKQ